MFGMGRPGSTTYASKAAALACDLRGFAGKLRRRLREQADIGDLTSSQTAVLVWLEKEGSATTSSLARAEGMRPQSMGAVIAALQGAGLISGTPDPKDGRQTILSLTDACTAWLREARAARQHWLTAAIQERLTADERDQLAAALPLLRRLIDD